MTRYAFRRSWMRAAAGLLDSVGGVFFRPNSKALPTPRNLLIVRLDHLGDVWNITGLPKAVKEYFPGCRVTCLVSTAASSLLRANPFVDEVLCFDAPWFWKKRNALSQGQLLKKLKRRRFDAALSLRGDIREHWLLFRAGIPRRVGPNSTGGGFLLTHCVSLHEGIHETERLSTVGAGLGLPKTFWKPEIHFVAGERERLLSEVESKGLRGGGEFLGFQVEARSSAKTWSVEHCAEFLGLFLNYRPHATAVLLGSDPSRAEKILKLLDASYRSRILDFCGRTVLRELAAAAGRFSLVIAPDSGPGHLLAWLDTPVIFLYAGSNRFESWKPLAESATVLRHEVSCSPCGLRVCPVAGHPCMESIQPKQVLSAALERLR